MQVTVVELEGSPGSMELAEALALRSELATLTGRTSVPSIWIDGRFVGGFNDGGLGGLVPLYRSGMLQSMLRAAGAF